LQPHTHQTNLTRVDQKKYDSELKSVAQRVYRIALRGPVHACMHTFDPIEPIVKDLEPLPHNKHNRDPHCPLRPASIINRRFHFNSIACPSYSLPARAASNSDLESPPDFLSLCRRDLSSLSLGARAVDYARRGLIKVTRATTRLSDLIGRSTLLPRRRPQVLIRSGHKRTTLPQKET
jgi:hypothetical protein